MPWITTKDGKHINTDWIKDKKTGSKNSTQKKIDSDNDKKEMQIKANKEQADKLNGVYKSAPESINNKKVENAFKMVKKSAGKTPIDDKRINFVKEEYNLNSSEVEELKSLIKKDSEAEGKKVKFPNKRVDQKDLTNEKIQAEIAGNSYMLDSEYQKHMKDASDFFEKGQELDKEISDLKEQLKPETMRKPKEEWTFDDEIGEMIGIRAVKYTEKGEALKQKLDELESARRGAKNLWEESVSKMKKLDEKYGSESRKKTMNEKFNEKLSSKLKDDYPGFKKNESTTPYIDDLLEKGKAEVVSMSPKLYIQEAATSIFDNSSVEKVLRGRNAKDVAKYMTMMEEGIKFDTPYLNYRDKNQEGLHRAIAAYMLGIDEIPVIVVHSNR